MAITNKTRKILWGRSGNRCAICRLPLAVDRTTKDDHSIIGDECHIHSGAPNGPRYDQSVDPSKIDEVENLLLLCRVHHKMVDDQFETYTADLLRTIKLNHEEWVNAAFEESEHQDGLQIVRFENEKPTHLMPIESGHELLNMIAGCHGHYPYYSDNLSDDEIEQIGAFMHIIKELTDIVTDLEPIERLRASKTLTEEMQELRHVGFRVFGSREIQQLRGGISPPSNFYVFHIAIVREDEAAIVPIPGTPRNETKDQA